jgi:hypothetical protein
MHQQLPHGDGKHPNLSSIGSPKSEKEVSMASDGVFELAGS